MDPAGRIVLNKRLRGKLNLNGPAVFRVDALGNRIELELIPSKSVSRLRKKGRLLVLAGTGKKFNAVEAIEQARADRE